MDPEACLVRAQEALNDSEPDECIFALSDYWKWRARGGFMPENGDTRAIQIKLDWNKKHRGK